MGIWPGQRGYTPTLYEKCHGIFNDHRESGPRFNVSSERQCLLTVQCPRHYTGALGPTQTTVWAPPAGLTDTSSSSNLVFPGGLPSRYWPGSALLSFSGQPVLGCRVIWLWQSRVQAHPQFITLYLSPYSPFLTVYRLKSFSPNGAGRFSIGSSQTSPSSPGCRWGLQCSYDIS